MTLSKFSFIYLPTRQTVYFAPAAQVLFAENPMSSTPTTEAAAASPHRLSESFKNALHEIVGDKGMIDEAQGAPMLQEWRGRWQGQAAAIVAPKSVDEVCALVKLCAAQKVPITPQGGNTGLVGGQIPHGPEVLVTLKRLNKIREVSALGNTMSVDAGVTLAQAQEAAQGVDRLFALSIGSEGTCQIGGNISTNAGGVNVLRYGNMRDQVLGLEVVLPNGELWNGLKRLRKNNTGYDLKHLFIGGEGTLGIVTGAVLKLHPRQTHSQTVLAGCPSAEAAVELLSLAQSHTGGCATSFELMGKLCFELIEKHIHGARNPLSDAHNQYVLMEFGASNGSIVQDVERMLTNALERGVVTDAVIAQNETHAKSLWHMRHSISEAISGESAGVRHDVSVATSDIPAFLKEAERAVTNTVAGARIVAFGHIGDGNVHYDVIGPKGAALDALEPKRKEIEAAVYQVINMFDGSISAEHGIGTARKEALRDHKAEPELEMMRAVKAALDPHNIMNPGKML